MPLRPASKGIWIGAALVVLVGGGTALALKLLPGSGPEMSGEHQSTLLASARPVDSATPSPSVVPSAAIVPATTAHITIVTDPPGAVVTKEGFQICDTTPCEIDVQRDDRLTLEAKKDKLKGSAKVLANNDQTVNIKLTAPTNGKAAQPCYQEVIEGELKVMKPVPCK